MTAGSNTSRARGARAEVNVVNWLRGHGWPEARRYLAGDGRQPGDIDAIPGLCIEVKDRSQSSWPAWCRQAETEAGGRAWVVVRRHRGHPDVAAWPCRFHTLDMAAGAVGVATFGAFIAAFTKETTPCHHP